MTGILVGKIRPEQLVRAPETDWFQFGYDLFSFDDAESYRKILGAAPGFGSMEVLVFIGTWCGDCQDHLPGFMRILDAVKFPRERLRIYGMDRARTFPGGDELIRAHNVRRLPTFIFIRDGQEIGRIIETPKASLLRDMAAILGSDGK